jgi:FkbM family methyltransferase
MVHHNGKLFEDKSIELFFTRYLKKKDSMVIIDIGAQIGLYTLYAKKLNTSTFYSFEPYDVELNILKSNVKLNNLQNVILSDVAISNKKETKILNVCSNSPGLSTLGENPIRWDDNSSPTIKKTVQTDTIDNLFENITVDMIKIDTEGWEYYILQGAEKIILRDKPNIQIEWFGMNLHQCNVIPSEFENYIRNVLNYEITVHEGLDSEIYLTPK